MVAMSAAYGQRPEGRVSAKKTTEVVHGCHERRLWPELPVSFGVWATVKHVEAMRLPPNRLIFTKFDAPTGTGTRYVLRPEPRTNMTTSRTKMNARTTWVLVCALRTAACLDGPRDPEELPFVFGLEGVAAEDAPRIESDPAFADEVQTFPGELPYLRGFWNDVPTWYWHIPEPASDAIAPVFRLERDGVPFGLPIIDVIPGQNGYSPWWRVHRVPVTPLFDDQKIWSREAVDAALELGLVEAPVPTEQVLSAPVVRSETVVDLGFGLRATPTDVWYRNHRVAWVRFSLEQRLPQEVRNIPVRTLFRVQREGQSFLLNEREANFDLDGDGALSSTNDLFDVGPNSPLYTPAWTEVRVRAVSDLQSFDDGTPELTSASQVLDDEEDLVLSVGPGAERVSCPLQATRGEL